MIFVIHICISVLIIFISQPRYKEILYSDVLGNLVTMQYASNLVLIHHYDLNAIFNLQHFLELPFDIISSFGLESVKSQQQ